MTFEGQRIFIFIEKIAIAHSYDIKMQITTYSDHVTHICFSKLYYHRFRQWLVACSTPSHYLNQWWHTVKWTRGNNCQWVFLIKIKIFLMTKMHLKWGFIPNKRLEFLVGLYMIHLTLIMWHIYQHYLVSFHCHWSIEYKIPVPNNKKTNGSWHRWHLHDSFDVN